MRSPNDFEIPEDLRRQVETGELFLGLKHSPGFLEFVRLLEAMAAGNYQAFVEAKSEEERLRIQGRAEAFQDILMCLLEQIEQGKAASDQIRSMLDMAEEQQARRVSFEAQAFQRRSTTGAL